MNFKLNEMIAIKKLYTINILLKAVFPLGYAKIWVLFIGKGEKGEGWCLHIMWCDSRLVSYLGASETYEGVAGRLHLSLVYAAIKIFITFMTPRSLMCEKQK